MENDDGVSSTAAAEAGCTPNSTAAEKQRIDEIDTFFDCLRWSCHQMRLTLKMARPAGVSRSVYLNLETDAVDYCSREIADTLAAVVGVTVDELLDAYNRFLYHGQGQAIKSYREQLVMGKPEILGEAF